MMAISVETRTDEGDGGEGGGPGGRPGGGPGPGDAPEVHTMELMGRVIGRLADGVTASMAAEEGTTLLRGLREDELSLEPPSVAVTPVLELLVGPVRSSLLLLMGAVGFVLLIACANVANLVMARSGERRREMAVRSALGAGSWQLASFVFVESLLLSAVGAVAGVGLAWLGLRSLAAQAPDFIPRLGNIAIDGRVILFTLGVTVLTALLFSLVPIRGATRLELNRALKDEVRGPGRGLGRNAMRKLLVTAEVALSVVLLVGATLLVTSFIRLATLDPGYDADNLLQVRMQLPASAYPEATAHRDFYDRLTTSLRQTPGVIDAAVTSSPPSNRANIQIGISRTEGPVEPDQQPEPMGIRIVGPEYTETIRANLIAGRGFTDEDRAESGAVVIMSESAARIMFGEEDPLGKPLHLMGPEELEVVGVTRDVRSAGTDPVPLPDVFLPIAQASPQMVPMLFRTATLLVRTGPAPMTLVPAIRGQIGQLDSSVPILDVMAVRDSLSESVAEPRFYASLVAAFALVALVLAAVGIYGLLSYTVQQGVRDTAIRRALGAPIGEILRGVVAEGMILAALGLVVGIGAALTLTRVLESMLYDIQPTDLRSFVLVVAVFLVVALVAVWLPARRATRIDPMDVLRYDG
jgi:putative ABC transport system permease protein